MTLNERVALVLDWKICTIDDAGCWNAPDGEHFCNLPDYEHDIAASEELMLLMLADDWYIEEERVHDQHLIRLNDQRFGNDSFRAQIMKSGDALFENRCRAFLATREEEDNGN